MTNEKVLRRIGTTVDNQKAEIFGIYNEERSVGKVNASKATEQMEGSK